MRAPGRGIPPAVSRVLLTAPADPRTRGARVVAVLGALALPGLVGCESESSSSTGDEVPTAIAVEPSAFLGAVPCSDGDGAMQAYVATVFDVTSPDAPFVVASTRALPCGLPAEVRDDVVAGNRYRLEVDGFDLAAEALSPALTGSRDQVDADGAVVVPRWTTSCGPAGGVTAITDVRVEASPCAALTDGGTPGPASVTLDPRATLGTLACTSGGGTVDAFDVTPDGPLAALVDLACDGAPVQWDDVPVEPMSFLVAAHAGAELLTAGCSVTPRAGRRVSAQCSPLAASGALLFEGTCAEGVTSYRARIGSLFSSGFTPCADAVVFTPLAAGSYLATVERFDAQGGLVDTLTCAAEVVPGQTAAASCF